MLGGGGEKRQQERVWIILSVRRKYSLSEKMLSFRRKYCLSEENTVKKILFVRRKYCPSEENNVCQKKIISVKRKYCLSEKNTVFQKKTLSVRGISDHSREYQPPIPVGAEKDRGKVWNMDHLVDGLGETQGEM